MGVKIAIVGPESTGKSALAHHLALHYHCPWVPEVAREYLEHLNRPYTFEDVEIIARLQLDSEEKALENKPNLLICDTNLLVIKIWMEHAWGHCPDWISKSLLSRKYELSILCNTDLPWEPDPLREHPHLRSYFLEWYKRELEQFGCPWIWAKGSGTERMENVILDMDKHLNSVLED